MIRPAKAEDIPAIIALLHRGYAKTHYARANAAQIDVPYTKDLLLKAIFQHGIASENGNWVQVAEHREGICGLMLATLARVYVIGNKLMATDVLFHVDENAHLADAPGLLQNMIDWAWKSPWCVEVRCATTGIIDDAARAGRIMSKFGLAPYGNIYRMERPQQGSKAACQAS